MRIIERKTLEDILGKVEEEKEVVAEEVIEEAFDVKKVIKDLAGDFSKDNKSQMGGLQLLKGLATSDDPLANRFMVALDKATTKISNELSK